MHQAWSGFNQETGADSKENAEDTKNRTPLARPMRGEARRKVDQSRTTLPLPRRRPALNKEY
ncbi:hypothetical protein MKX54_19630 [Alkalihalobacillus sp. FSL R5-0424]